MPTLAEWSPAALELTRCGAAPYNEAFKRHIPPEQAGCITTDPPSTWNVSSNHPSSSLDLSASQRTRLAERCSLRMDAFEEVTVPSLPSIPGMISEAEGRYLYWLTSRGYTGAGTVVEVGSWLGRSTSYLVAGLRDAGFDRSIRCFDAFRWRRSHARKTDIPLRVGDDFQPFFERNVLPLYPGLRVTRSTIRDIVWDGEPIEILFLDAPKKLSDISSTLAAFGPSLVPGLSLIVLQDYQGFPFYPLAAVFSCLQDRVELVHVVEGGSAVGFLVRGRLDLDGAQPVSWNFGRWSAQDAVLAWKRILDPLPPHARARLSSGLALQLFDANLREDACHALEEIQTSAVARLEWQRYADSHLYARYWPLFDSLGIHSTHMARRLIVRLRWVLNALNHRSNGAGSRPPS